MTETMKWIVVVREDLKLPAGKLAAQVAHAAVESVLVAERSKLEKWRREGATKIVVGVETLQALSEIEAKARAKKLSVVRISDAGKTVVAPGTVTCIGIGPDKREKIDAITEHLNTIN